MAERSVYQVCEEQLFSEAEKLKHALSLKGSLPDVRWPEEVLLEQLSRLRAAQMAQDSSKNITSTYSIPEYYPPCTLSYKCLTKIAIRDLRILTHHLGKHLVLRVVSKPLTSTGILAVVKDARGDAERLALHNQDPTYPVDELLPEGSVVAIKQPYYHMLGQDQHVIRIDHISDLVFVIRPEMTLKMTLDDWLLEGIKALHEKNILRSINYYTEGIRTGISTKSESEKDVVKDLLLERALTNLEAERFEAARDDCLKIARTFLSLDNIARRCFARALYKLGHYQKAKDHLVKIGDQDDHAEVQRVNKRLDEQRGIWDFRAIQAFAQSIHKSQVRHSIDVASYVSLTEVKDAGAAGRGLYARERIKARELILCEKAYSFTISRDNNRKITCIADIPKQRIKLASGESLLVETVQKLNRNPSSAPKLLDLYSGDYDKFPGLGTIVDGSVVIDTFHIHNLLTFNSMGSNAPGDRESSGLWIRAAYINHSCIPNSMHNFLGDLLVLRATRDISIGDQITFAYTPLSHDVDERHAAFQKSWGFTCSCRLCSLEIRSGTRTERHSVIRDFEQILPGLRQQEVFYISALEDMVDVLRTLYEEDSAYKHMPKLGLVKYAHELLTHYQQKQDAKKTVFYALQVLRGLGFQIEIKDGTITFDRTNAVFAPSARPTEIVQAFVGAADGFRALDQIAVGHQLELLAREAFLITTGGDDEAFAAMYRTL